MARGKTGAKAMKDAGYSDAEASNPGRFLQRQAVAQAIEKMAVHCSKDLIEGVTVEAMTGEDMGHKLQGATLAARLRGLLVDRSMNINVNASTPGDLAAMRAELGRLYNDAGDVLPATERKAAQVAEDKGVSGDGDDPGVGAPSGDGE